MAFLMMTAVGAPDTSSLITTSIPLKTSVLPLVLGAVTQRSEQRTIRSKGITTDKTQIYARGTTVPPVG
jgi:hypothetical protein